MLSHCTEITAWQLSFCRTGQTWHLQLCQPVLCLLTSSSTVLLLGRCEGTYTSVTVHTTTMATAITLPIQLVLESTAVCWHSQLLNLPLPLLWQFAVANMDALGAAMGKQEE